MGYFYYTLVAIGLYFLSDWLLNRFEEAYGTRFKYRSLIFFGIIFVLAMVASQIATLLTAE